VVDQHHQPRSISGLRPLQHFGIATGITEGYNGALPDEQIDPDRLARDIVNKKHFRLAHEDRFAHYAFGLLG
jgi:hypothetical protein